MTIIKRHATVVLFAFLFLASASDAFATHFRFGTISSRVPNPTLPNQVVVTVDMALRWTFYGTPTVGSTVNVGSITIVSPLNVYDSRNFTPVVQSVNQSNDWMFTRQEFSLTIPPGVSGQWKVQFSDCCRVSTLLDGNNDQSFILNHTFTTTAGAMTNNSPVAIGTPIRILAVNQPAVFQLPGSDPNGDTLTWRVATTAESGLPRPQPLNHGAFNVSSSGQVTWTPNLTGMFGIQVIADDGHGASTPMDFIMQVIPAVGAPPVLTINNSATPVTVNMPIGFPSTVTIKANDPEAVSVAINAVGIPLGATTTPAVPVAIGGGGTLTTVFSWTPLLSDFGTRVVEFSAEDGNGNFKTNSLTINVVQAELMYISGTYRNFETTDPGFNKADGDNSLQLVQDTLDAERKPVFNPAAVGSSTTVPGGTGFSNFYRKTPSQIMSFTATNALNADDGVFSFNANDFAGGDKLFTYEVHSYYTYTPGRNLTFKSSDDLWVFINGRLALDLGGVHATARQGTINGNTIAAQLGLIPGMTYSLDIFYAHRSMTHVPSMSFDLPETTLCSAIGAPVSTPVPVMLGTAATNGVTIGLGVANGLAPSSAAAWTNALQQVLSGFAVEFDFKINPAIVNGGEGLAFVLQAEGSTARGGDGANLGYAGITKSIAVEFDPHFDPAMGDPGYDHISIHTNLNGANSAAESVSIGRSVNDTDWTRGTPMNLNNNVVQHARIVYEPGLVDPNAPAGVVYGWIKVYLNNLSAPAVAGQISNLQMMQTFPAGTALFGFTSGAAATPQNTTATVEVNNFKIATPQIAPALSHLTQLPPAMMPDTLGLVTLQMRDSCNAKFYFGGNAASITATMSNTSGSYQTPVSITDQNDGTYKLTYTPRVGGQWTLDVRINNTPIVNNPFMVLVAPATPNLTVTGSTGPYTGSPRVATATLTGVFGETLAGPVSFTYNGEAAAINAGTYDAVGTFAGTPVYAGATASATVTITRVDPTVTVNSATVTYNGFPRLATASATGIMNEPLATPAVTYDPATPIHVGTYGVTADFAGDVNYKPASATGTLTIGPATPTVTVHSVNATYDAAAHPASATVNGVNGESFTTGVTFSYDGSPVAPINAGTYPVVATFSAAGDYGTATGTGSVVIGKASPTVTVNSDSVVYDAAPHTVTASVAGVGGAALGQADTITYDGSSTAPSDAGSYPVIASVNETQNYTAASGTGSLTIGVATPALAVTPLSFVYDGNAHESAAVLTGVGGVVIPGAVSFTYDAGSAAPTNVKSYAVAASFAGAGNYGPASASGTLDITPATPTVIVNNASFTFDGLTHGVTGTVTGLGGDALGPLTFTYGGSSAEPADAGTYAVVGSFAGSGNYGPATGNGALVIDKADATVTVQSASVTYNGAPHGATGTVIGINNTTIGTPALTYDGSPTAPTDAHTYTVVGSFAGNGNYNAASGSGTLTISPATATMQVMGGTFTYDGQQRPATVTVTGVNGTNLGPASITYNGGAAVPVNAGSYAVIASYAATNNYGAASATGTILINRAPLTVTADSKVMIQGAAVPALTASYAGFVNGETAAVLDVAVSLSTPATSASPIGTYPIVAAGASDVNYAIGFVNGTLTVDPDITPGLMRGAGFVRDDDNKYDFEFEVRERANGADRGRLELRVKDEGQGGKKGKKPRNDRFVSRQFTNVVFSDDPTIRPGRARRPQVDTVLFAGTGEWNGMAGYRFEAFAQDQGEPGRHRESLRITIFDSAGQVVAHVDGDLDGGNIQSARIKH